jgi:uncharacterized protein (TIGR02145 family)
MELVMNRIIKRDLCYLILLSSLAAFISCDELEPVNPADPSYKLKSPTLVGIEAITDVRIDLSWQNNEEYTEEFAIHRKIGSQPYTSIATTTKDVSIYSDTTCTLGVNYKYVIISKVGANLSTPSNYMATATVFPSVTNISINALSDAAAQITWEDNCSFEKGYRIERESGSGYELIVQTNENTTTYTDSSLNYDTNYTYRIAGFTSDNFSEWTTSPNMNVSFQEPSSLIGIPISETQIYLTWTDNSGNEDGFRIERNTSSGNNQIIEVDANVTEYTDIELTFGQIYEYRIAAFTSTSTSTWASTTTSIDFVAPSNFSANPISDSEVQLVWIDNTGFESGFIIERDEGNGFVQIANLNPDVTDYLDSGLTDGRDYNYRIAAYTSNISSLWALTSIVTEFAPPSNLDANALNDSEIQLSWTDNTSFEAGFAIERHSGGGFVAVGSVGQDVTEFVDVGLLFGQSYEYRISAFTAINSSSWITIVTSTVFPEPSNFIADPINDSEIQLSWEDNTSYEEGFLVERDAGIGFIAIATVIADVTEYIDIGLVFGQSYEYRIAAYTPTNSSLWASIEAATVFPEPSNLTADPISDTEIQLIWEDNASFELGFVIERNNGEGFVEIGTVSANETEFIDNEVAFGQIHEYRVAAFTSNNTSGYCMVTSSAFELEDYDGNVYGIAQIGDQVWMSENLKVTHYRDGTAIPNVTDGNDWANASNGAYCYHSNSTTLGETYGALYNWYTVGDTRNLAPEGWHIPSASEWQVLFDFVGGTEIAGGKLKEVGTVHWLSPNTGATNEYGFNALPSGERAWGGGFDRLGEVIFLWSSSSNGQYGTGVAMSNTTAGSGQTDWWKENGYSVRCVKD